MNRDICSFLPWQQEQAKQWLASKDKFAHAWLIHGTPGIGQLEFALAAAASLLCEQTQDGIACGACHACNWFKANNHPDLRRIRSEAQAVTEGFEADNNKKQPSKEIKIEQIRSLQPWFNTATHRGGLRVAVLYMAADLNLMAANSLLKVLEEPPAHTVFILVADAPDRLLPTLVSRCQRIHLSVPDPQQAIQWLTEAGLTNVEARLAAAGSAPIMALANASQDPVPVWLENLVDSAIKKADLNMLADDIIKEDTAYWIDMILRLWLDIGLVSHQLPSHYFPSLEPKIKTIAVKVEPDKFFECKKWLYEQKALAKHPLNPKLLTETAVNRIISAIS